MLAAPAPAAYDLRFRLLDVPVRVNVWFWLVMLMMTGRSERDLTFIAAWVGCAFVSILVHEFGHALTSRATGHEPIEVVLYGMGGLCYSDSAGQRPLGRFLVIAAGPAAGFAFLGLVLLVAKVSWGVEPVDALATIGFGPGDALSARLRLPHTIAAYYIFRDLVFINLMWGLLNLLPIWPLDGGQMTEVVLNQINRREGTRWTHAISLLTAGGLAAYVGSRPDPDWLRVLLLGYFAYSNYRQLQEIHQFSRFSGDDDGWHNR